MIDVNKQLWLAAVIDRVNFFRRSMPRIRKDKDFPWKMVQGSYPTFLTRQVIGCLKGKTNKRLDWLKNNSENIWKARSAFADQASRDKFDEAILIRIVGQNRYYFQRVYFDEALALNAQAPFFHAELPDRYLGLPIQTMNLSCHLDQGMKFNVAAPYEFVEGVNWYRQYLIKRGNLNLHPNRGDHVLDCGACIGDVSILFAALVHPSGSVHAFDPIPLHVKFIKHQSEINPALVDTIKPVELAVSNRTDIFDARGVVDKISPGAKFENNLPCTTIDDYVTEKMQRVDYIKMDIEGAELDALEGATSTIKKFKPKLAISSYHLADHMWQIPLEILKINPDYDLYFEHHSPLEWESVVYAI